MKEKIVKILEQAIGGTLPAVEVFVPEQENFGHYSTNVAMRLSGGEKPLERAARLAAEVAKTAPEGFFEKVQLSSEEAPVATSVETQELNDFINKISDIVNSGIDNAQLLKELKSLL